MERLLKILDSKAFYAAVAVLVLAVMVAIGVWRSKTDNTEFAKRGAQLIFVEEGMTTADIAQLLHEKQLVKDVEAFRWEARFRGLAEKLQAGPYRLEGGMSNREIVETMVKGRIKLVRFTIPEGYTIAKVAQKLEDEHFGSKEKFMAAAKDYAPYDYMQTDDPAVLFKSEGFIYPATYDFAYGMPEDKLLKLFVDQFDQEVQPLLTKAKAQGISVRDMVNIAAMVELEAVYPEEHPRIAGVFLKRLEIGMPIQSDTTIQYILGTQKEIITFKDTEIENPYNTYYNQGLPPGPIGCPSLSAMEAVLQPEEHDYLYFVAEKDGHHRFTRSYAEHLQAIEAIDGGY